MYPGNVESCDGVDNNATVKLMKEWERHTISTLTVMVWRGNSIFLVRQKRNSTTADDCDDLNNTIYPGAMEICDGADNNCDGTIDEDVQNGYFADSDGDGYGNEDSVQFACSLKKDSEGIARL